MRDIADYLVGGYADSVYPDNLRIFHYGNCPVLKGPIVVKVQYNKHGEYVGTTGNISIASGQTKTFCLEHYVPYDGIPGNAIVIWLVSEEAPTPPPEPTPEPTPTPTGVEIPSAFQPYIVNISGLSNSQEVSWKGVPVLIWWGEGFVTLKGWIKVAEQHATKAGEQISWNEYVIETGQTRTFSNVTGQDMSIYLLGTAPAPPTYTCPYCPATFGTQKELDDHIASEHPTPPPPPPGKFTWNGCKLIFAGHIDVDDVLAAGFNTAICYVNKDFLDDCLEKGLWVIPSVHTYFNTSPVDLDGAKAFIKQWKNHAAVAAWWFLNEPDLRSHMTSAKQKEWYKALKEEDPNHDLLTTFTAHIEKNWEPAAFDHVSFDAYPYTDETPLWKPRLQNSCSVCKSRSGAIGGMAVAQGYYGCGQLNPDGIIDDMLEVWQSYGIGTQKDGYAMYAWTDGGDCPGGGTGISEDAHLLAHMTAVNASYAWPHAPPGEKVVYSCPYCPATFGTQKELDDHIASEHPEETFTTKDITCSRCGSRLRVTISSIPANNVTQNCSICGLSVREGTKIEILHAEPWPPPTYTCPHCGATFSTQEELDEHIASEHPAETFTTKDITCSVCESLLRITISSIAENNKTLTCPLCQTTLSQAGTKVEILSTPVIDQLRADITALDEQIGQAETKVAGLKDTIAEAKAKVDAIKKLLGM